MRQVAFAVIFSLLIPGFAFAQVQQRSVTPMQEALEGTASQLIQEKLQIWAKAIELQRRVDDLEKQIEATKTEKPK